MSETTTISTKLVSEGVGLPDDACEVVDLATGEHGHYLFEHSDGEATYFFGWDQSEPVRPAFDLSSPATAFDVALKLDAWERAGDPDWLRGDTWAQRVLCDVQATPSGESWFGHRLDMIARLTHIGQDAALRRHMGHEPDPGTLWEWDHNTKSYGARNWEIGAPGRGPYEWLDDDGYAGNPNDPTMHRVWGVPGITAMVDEVEARAAAYAELCGGEG